MGYVNFYGRINNFMDLKLLSESICEKYEIGSLISYKHIEVGYEDFNMMIETTRGKYFAKFLNVEREDSDSYRLAKILEISCEQGIKLPRVYKLNEKSIVEISIRDFKLKLILMEYIEGTNMIFLKRDFTENEIKQVAKQISLINQTNYEVDSYYDEWTVINFISEYDNKIEKIELEDKKLIEKIYKEIKNLDFEIFPKAYIHADILKSNLILDNENNVWVIDFSVLNYLPRIIEVGVAMFGICMTDDREKTIKNFNLLLNEYNKYFRLNEFEKSNMVLVFNAICAMNLLEASYIKAIGENFEENTYWIEQGRKGIILNLKNEELIIQ